MPEISVVMPVYNGAQYLPEAIESVLDQSYGDFEYLIVCEHGSDEASMAVVEGYAAKDERIRLIRNERRLGIAASLNVGLAAAQGRYIARMDGDDVSGRRRFEVQRQFLESYPEIGVCGIHPRVLYPADKPGDFLLDYGTDPEQMESDLLFFIPMRHPSVMFRGELTRTCAYDETLAGGEEYSFFYRMSLQTKLGNIPDPTLFSYRRTGENASRVYLARDTFIRRETMREIFRQQLGMEFENRQMDILNFLGNTAYDDLKKEQYPAVVEQLERLLEQIEEQNERKGVYRPACLRKTLEHRWFREKRRLRLMMKGQLTEAVERALAESRYASVWF